MEVWLVVQGDDGSLHDVAARIPGEGSAAQLAQALASELGLADPPPGQAWGLYSHRLESWLAPGTLASTLDVHHGDTVALTLVPATGGLPWAATGPVASALVEVRVTAGADIGRSWRLGAEEHVVGRADDAEIRLEDPFLAPAHARLSVAVDRVVVRDLGGPGGTRLDGDEVQDSRVVRPGSTITVGGSSLVLTRLSEPSAALGGGATEVSFNRQPRVIQPSSDYVHRLAAPPAEVRKPRLPLLTALLPLLLGGVMLLFTHSLLTLVFIVLSPVLAIGSYVESRLGGRGDFRRARAEFEDQLGAVEADLQSGTSEEVRRRNAEAPQLRHLALMAHRRDPTLWERRPQDDDFLALRLGLADQPSRHRVEFGDGGSSHLRQQAQVRLQPFGSVAGVPVVVPLSDRAVVGLAGPRSAVLDLARWLALQACCLHSPRNLAICAALPPEEAAAWDWLKWLPHTAPSARQVEGPALCSDNTGGRDLVERLVGLLDARAAEVGPFRGSSARSPYPYVLALLHEDLPLGRGSLTRLLAEGPRVGILVMWLGSAVRDLPNECRAVVEVDADAGVRLTYPEDGRHQAADGRGDRASSEEARQVALELAPLRDAGAADARGQLPRHVGLIEVLGMSPSPTAAEVTARWAAAGRLRAPVGATTVGPFEVDLGVDGPHGLVGGTTGAGKSELLQSLVAALAASDPPSRLNFLLVDYKGGSAFRDAVRLPHTVGLVTDLDEHLARRALVSLRSELRRREEVLRDASARDLAELERRGAPGCPASLVIVVDEFATLAREVPEFVEGVVDLAQRGRSLGLHLVLATQRPAGVVSDSIRANTNLRIALRMSDESESSDVIGVPDAARIPRSLPGRAFARTGHRELTEFQAAYSGTAPVATAGEVEVLPLGLGGPVWPMARAGALSDTESDLHRIVLAVKAAHAAGGGVEPPRPWLPQLPAVVSAGEAPGSAGPLAMSLGLIDLPQEQRQQRWVVDLGTEGNLLVFGTAGSGKTSLLRLVAHSLALAAKPSGLHIYAVDCAGGGLAALQALPHCGAYIRADETERLARLVRWLRAVVDSRRARVADAMSASRGAGSEASVVVLLDGYSGFASAMDRVDLGEHLDSLPRLVADGPAVGVHFVLTAERRGAVPAAVTSVVSSRLVLRMADEDEYRNAGVPGDAHRGAHLPPGRGFLAGAEVQCAVLGDDGSAERQLSLLQETGAALVAGFGDVQVPGVRVLPARVEVADLAASGRPLAAVIGLLDANLGPAELDLAEDGQLVLGPPHSGRSTTLSVAASALRAASTATRLVLIAPRRSPLTDLDVWDEVATGLEACGLVAASLAAALQRDDWNNSAMTVVVIDDGEEVAEGAVGHALEVVARRGQDGGVRLLGAVETRAAHRAYAGWVAEVRKARQGILLQPDIDIDGDLLGVRLPRHATGAFPLGRAYLVRRGIAHLIQVAVPART